MAGRNPWMLPGNGILSGLTLAGANPNVEDEDTPHESAWAQAVREAWEKRLDRREDGSTDPAPYSQSPLTFTGAGSSAPWPLGAPSSNMFVDQTLWPELPLFRSQRDTLAPPQGSSSSDFWPRGSGSPGDVRGYGAAAQQLSDRLNASTGDQGGQQHLPSSPPPSAVRELGRDGAGLRSSPIPLMNGEEIFKRE